MAGGVPVEGGVAGVLAGPAPLPSPPHEPSAISAHVGNSRRNSRIAGFNLGPQGRAHGITLLSYHPNSCSAIVAISLNGKEILGAVPVLAGGLTNRIDL